MRSWQFGFCLATALLPPLALADEPRHISIDVQEAYLDLRALPDLRYPAANIAERGEQVQLIKSRTNWYLLRNAQGQQGWVLEEQMGDSLKTAGIAPTRYALLNAEQAAAKNKN